MLATFLLASSVTITLPDAAKVTGTEMTVGAIATVTGDDPAEVKRVEALSLGYAPAPGFSRLMQAERISADLKRLVPELELEVTGALRCRVTPSVVTLTAAKLLEESGRVLRAGFEGADAKITATGPLSDLVVPAAAQTLELEASLPEKERAAGTWNVPVVVRIDGNVYRTVWTSWTVELWERQYVLRRAVSAGMTLRAEDFEVARVPVGPGVSNRTLQPATFGHAVARRDLAKGAVVTDGDVQRQVVIKRGDTISLEVHSGTIIVRALAIAQRDARVGDRIPVRLEQTGKELVAIVRGPETAEFQIK